MPSKENKKLNETTDVSTSHKKTNNEKTQKSVSTKQVNTKQTKSKHQNDEKKNAKQNQKSKESDNSTEPEHTVNEVNFKTILKTLDKKVSDAMKDQLKTFREDIKALWSVHKEELSKKKTKKNKKPHKPTGFEKKRSYFGKLAEYIDVSDNTLLSGPELTSKVWNAFDKNGRKLKSDKRVIVVDKEISELFDVSLSVNKIKDSKDQNGFNFCTLQRYLKPLVDKYSTPVDQTSTSSSNDQSSNDQTSNDQTKKRSNSQTHVKVAKAKAKTLAK
jgi:hypothetical protein